MYDTRLILFNKIMHRVPWEERRYLISKLENLKISTDETLSYKKENLMFSIYRATHFEPLMEAPFPSLMSKNDKRNYLFSEQIMSGINGYLQAPIEKQKALQNSLLTPWSPQNILARSYNFSRKRFLPLFQSVCNHFSR